MKILRSALSCLLAATVLAGAGYAWYAQRITNRTGNFGVLLTEEGSGTYATTYTVYRYKDDYNMGIERYEPSPTKPIQMLRFDSVFTDRNVYTPLLICIPTWGTSVTKVEDITVTLNLKPDSALTDDDGDLKSALSNIISVRCGCVDLYQDNNPRDPEDMDPAGVYTIAHTALHAKTSGVDTYPIQTFVLNYSQPFKTDDTVNWTKRQSITFTVKPPNHPGQDEAYVFIELDYHATLVNEFKRNLENRLIAYLGTTNVWACEADIASIVFGAPAAS